MRFEWDPTKAAQNLRKHRVSFQEVVSIFYDPLASTGADPDHSEAEQRFATFGISSAGRLLVVAHTEETKRFALSALVTQLRVKGVSTKKTKASSDELRPQYKRSDFKKLERGKYYERVKESSNVVILDPNIAAVFPNSAEVNKALHSLMKVNSRASRLTTAPSRSARLRRSNG